jgi:hypothetical protein
MILSYVLKLKTDQTKKEKLKHYENLKINLEDTYKVLE